MSEPKSTPDQPKPSPSSSESTQGSPTTQGNQGGEGGQRRDFGRLIYTEQRGQNPDTISTKIVRPESHKMTESGE